MATIALHSAKAGRQHRPVREALASVSRAWVYKPVLDIALAAIVYVVLNGTVLHARVAFTVLTVAAVAWAAAALRVPSLRRPRPGFPEGVPVPIRRRVVRLIAGSVGVLFFGGLMLVAPEAEMAALTLAACSLGRACVVLPSIFSYRHRR